MKFQLICRELNHPILEELFSDLGFEIDHQASFVVVEKGLHYGGEHIALIVDPNKQDSIISCLNQLIALRSKGECSNDLEKDQAAVDNSYILGRIEEKYSMIPYESIKYFSANSNDVYFHSDKEYHQKT